MPPPVSRRDLLTRLLPLGAATSAPAAAAGPASAEARAGAMPTAMPTSTPAAMPTPLHELDITALQAQMAAGQLTSLRLVRHFLRRIEALDRRGPTLRSVIELNPDAVAQAKALDAERRRGLRGPLHGIPVLLKDNIATGDGMATSAGSLALAGLHATRDAHLARRLRDAGAVILGKTNLSEWANIRSNRSSSGWSSRGGQTLNPHALTRSPSGSSSGSAVAVAAGLCVVAAGTETDGSITSPANACGVVGLKPTLGRVSRHGVIPIAASQDTAGPMARSVRDAALLLAAMSGVDPADPATAAAPPMGDVLAALNPQALRGARIGVARAALPPQPRVAALFEQALEVLRAQGAELVDPVELPPRAAYGASEFAVLLTELKVGLADYLRQFQPDAPFADLAGLIAWNRANAARAMPFFDQELLEEAALTEGLANKDYLNALATNHRSTRAEGLDALFKAQRLDAVVAPSGNLAWLIDHLLGDHFTGGGISSPFAVAGYPHITVPMGTVSALPVGLSFGALAWQDARLLGLAHAYEQASRRRVWPRFLADAG